MTGADWPIIKNPGPSKAGRPRGWARIGGTKCSVLKFTVTQKRHMAANTFSLHLEPFQQPEGFDLRYWADDAPGGVEVEIFAGFLPDDADVSALPDNPTSLILGIADDMACDPLTGTLTVTGRDKTALLIDQKTSNRWPQHTSSQIVTQLAQQAGLGAAVTATSTPVGEYYRTSYGQLARSLPMWDLVAYLAHHEGFDAYVTGSTLYFQAPQTDTPQSGPFQVVIGRDADGMIQSNASVLRLHRRLVLAQNLSVDVKSHHTARGSAIKANASRAAKGKGGAGTLAYSVSRPNRSQKQAQQLANNMLGELAQHEFGFTATMDADLSFSLFRQVQLVGTGTSFDTVYDPSEVTWEWDAGEGGGLKMTFTTKLAPQAGQGSADDPLAAAGSTTGVIDATAPGAQ